LDPGNHNDCDAPQLAAGLMGFEAALAAILDDSQVCGPIERLPTASALDRVLAEPVLAGLDLPPFAASAMDGYALISADSRRPPAYDSGDGDAGSADANDNAGHFSLKLVGTSAAGRPFAGRVQPGQCIRILTGAVMPSGADAVVIQELCEASGDRVRMPTEIEAGANLRPAGDDVRAGDRVVEAGRRLRPSHLAAIAALGVAELAAWRQPRVAYFSTGDELRPLGAPLAPGEIYDSNRVALGALLRRAGVLPMDLGRAPDEREALRRMLSEAAGAADAVITTGGVSVGDADYVKDEVAALGEVTLWRIAMKPGKPLAVGRIGDARFFGLPGNPVSALVTFYQLVLPALRRMGGEASVRPFQVLARTETRLSKRPGRSEFQRGILGQAADGSLTVGPAGGQGSHMLGAMSRADCFVTLPQDCGEVETGQWVAVQPFEGLV
jgi:molybdopterin molybdotransferase